MATTVEWSPNEGILRKLERLAFALIRTRPVARQQPREVKRRNPWTDKCRGLAGPFALGILIGIPTITEVSTGSTLIAALLLAALDASLAVWCYTDLESQHGQCNGHLFSCLFSSVGEFPAFLVAWWRISGFSAAFAAVCRSLSAIVDAVTGRHAQVFVEDHFGEWLPLGAKIDLLALFVAMVPTFMCALGMEESGFFRFCLFLLTSATTFAFFGSSLGANNQGSGTVPVPIVSDIYECLPDGPEGTLYVQVLSGAALASVGFFGLYKTCCPDGPSVHYNHQGHQGHRHYILTKRFSLIGCLISTVAFLFYFLEATVLGKSLHTSRICRDPPLLWALEGKWRIGIASLGISALSLATFEFLIPLCSSVTKLANDGLLYRLLKKDRQDFEEAKWTLVTPLVFGALGALQAVLVETKVLLGFVSCSLMCVHVVIGASMLASRYQVKIMPSPHQKVGQTGHRTRPRMATATLTSANPGSSQTRRLLTVSFMKSAKSKNPNETKVDLDGPCPKPSNSDRSCLMDNVGIAPIETQDSVELSVGSAVSGYESDSSDGHESSSSEHGHGHHETNIDLAVADHQEHLRLTALNGGAPLCPTPASARRVSFSTVFLVIGCITLAASLNRFPQMDMISGMLAVSSGLLIFLLLVVISRQAQRPKPMSQGSTTKGTGGSSSCPTSRGQGDSGGLRNFFHYSLVPCGPAVAIFLHSCLLVEALNFCGFLFAIWFATGLIIYFSYGVSKSVAAPNLISLISPNVTPNERVGLTPNVNGHRTSPHHHQHEASSTSNLSQSDSISFHQCGNIHRPPC